MSILSVDTIQPIGSGSTVTLNAAKIVVGTGITFESNGQAIYAGIITATSFSGSGANLTNINSTSATGDFSIADKIVHTGNTNTTIRFPAADTITAETGGSERLRIDSGGRMGLGTNNPTKKLTVQAGANNTDIALFAGNDLNRGLLISTIAANSQNDMGVVYHAHGQHGGSYLGEHIFKTNNTERLRITSAGNIEVATTTTTSPAYIRLNANRSNADDALGGVYGVWNGNSVAAVNFKTGADTSNKDDGELQFVTYSGGAAHERLRINSYGFCIQPFKYQLVVQRSGNLTGYDANGSFGTALVFNSIASEVKDSALSSCFNTSNGLFTAPVEGIYFCEASAYAAGQNFSQAWFTVSGSRAIYTDWVMGSSGSIVNCNAMIKLSATATVGFHPHGGGGQSSITINASGNHTWMRITFMG
jgi:hypothetical protein